MLPRILSVVTPIFVYATLIVLGQGLWFQRRKFEWLAMAPALAGLIASFVFLAPGHRLFFDEDIYIGLAANLTQAPVAQITLVGSPGNVEVSSYYKEPPGWPVLLSLVFLLTGRSETVAFVVARLLFAIMIAAVYQLAREVVETRKQAIAAAILFGGAPVCFWFSPSAGTDMTSALFATLGLWGCIAGNGPLAAAGLALAAQTRLELIILIPMIWIARRIRMKWKVLGTALVTAQVAHIGWVLSIAPALAKAEKVESAFSLGYVYRNFVESMKYLLDPMAFPFAIGLLGLAGIAISFRTKAGTRPGAGLFAMQPLLLFSVYLLFYAGSFQLNPRYAIQIIAPLAVMAASLLKRPLLLSAALLSLVLCHVSPRGFEGYVQSLASDHRISTEFASKFGPKDVVLSTEAEMFLNQGFRVMNAAFIAEHREKLDDELQKRGKVIYHAGVRTNVLDSREWVVDQWVKSNFELHLIDSRDVGGMRIAFYEVLLKPIDRKAGRTGALKGQGHGGPLRRA